VRLAQLPVELGDTGADVAPVVLDALDCLRVAVTIFDSDERLLYANAHYNYLFRSMPRAEALPGRTYDELIRLEIVGGETALDGGIEDYVAARRAQFHNSDYAPRDIRLCDGRIIEIKARRTAEGGWIALWSDATHARHVLGRLEDAIDLSADAFAFWDARDRLTLCNADFAQLHGQGRPEDLTGIIFEDLIQNSVRRGHVKIDGDAQAWIARRVETHRSPAGTLTVEMASGAAYLVRERATRDGGRATVYTDVTDRRRVESALKKSEIEAAAQATYLADLTARLDAASSEADTAKTTLLRTMSHELKTPLNAILGFADLLRSTAPRFSMDQIVEYSGLIHMAGRNLLRLINQILDLTKVAAGRFPLQHSAVPVATVLHDAYDQYRVAAGEKAIAFRIRPCPADAIAMADEAALITMVRNLVENAVAFTHNGGEISLSAERAGDYVRIRIADNGPGVAAADLLRIVQPFEQAGRSMHDHPNGAGLGLPLVKSLAEMQGGALILQSALGEGFAATLQLPAA
jgi:two-component system, cell cycle sensor histidine kinase PleC